MKELAYSMAEGHCHCCGGVGHMACNCFLKTGPRRFTAAEAVFTLHSNIE